MQGFVVLTYRSMGCRCDILKVTFALLHGVRSTKNNRSPDPMDYKVRINLTTGP